MNQVLHFFRKDLRLMRWPLLYLVIWLLGTMYWYALLPVEKRMIHIGALSLWRYFIWIMCFLIIGGFTQRDAPLREGAFFRTRPVALSTVLRSKFLIATLIVVMSAMIKSVSLLMLGLKPGVLDFLLIFAEEILVLSALGAVSMALALRQEAAGKYFASAASLIGVMIIGWITFTWCKSAFFRNEKPDWSYTLEYLKASRLLMAQAVVLAGSVTGIVLFVRSGRRETISNSLAITALCALAVLFFWPLNFVKACVPAQREAPKNEWPDPAKLKITLDPTRHSQSRFTKYSSGYNGFRYRSIESYHDIKGLSPDWFPNAANGYRSEIVLADGRVIKRHRESWGPVHPTAILHQLKMKPEYPKTSDREWRAELAEFKLESYPGSLSGATLEGEIFLPMHRAVILARAPLKEGLSLRVHHRQFQIPRIETIGNELHCTLIEATSSSNLRGGVSRLSEDRIAYLIIQKDRGEFLQLDGGGQSPFAAGHCFFLKTDFEGVIFPPDKKKPVTPEWLAGAEFLVIGQEYGGTLSQAFDFSDVNLGTER